MTPVPSHGQTIRARQALLLLLLASLLGLRAGYLQILDPPQCPPPQMEDAEKGASGKTAPARAERTEARSARKPLPAGPLDLNRASREELMSLPGIGPVLAERILAFRKENGPFPDIFAIKQVPGIGEKRFERIRPWIEARGR